MKYIFINKSKQVVTVWVNQFNMFNLFFICFSCIYINANYELPYHENQMSSWHETNSIEREYHKFSYMQKQTYFVQFCLVMMPHI